ncbi:cytochrome P450 [Pseudonocardia sp. EC080610-09]|uniref:cytochrome P450 n=1 Tax=unclassified Pseudonocardia TaxID=2619320 RepID=UPI0006CB634C|nr:MULTISPECIES: cytochrome P450 [unclassified Pseudonocardia]ALE72160.1 cytochrome P450 [Pseudonocardia sp. EC080625-04]ALL75445.1 cytochrome P450 [Pseudonocardia sp. EC080610-09]ALL82471.1 cytochrome P450 [Pseudonocardia sp. EC080619-01]
MTAARAHDPVDISSRAFWARPPDAREESFAELRRERPLSWHPPAETDLLPDPDAPGFWALVTHADITAVSRDAETFASGQRFGGVMLEDVPEDMLEAAHSILAMDAPRHVRQRRVIASVFTPRRVQRISDQIREQARLIVDELLAQPGEVDFVGAVSARLPMWTISEMIGIPEPDRQRVADAANAMVGWNDPDFIGDGDPMAVLLDGLMTLHTASFELSALRREEPADDLMTALVQAEVEGASLTDEEIAAFFVLLCVAGNDTTRQTASHAVLALDRNPEQRRLLVEEFDDRIGPAVEEFVRWASPVLTFRRTATRDTEIRGQRIAEGERVVMFYHSGNRDESVFADPHAFDVTRAENPHVGFGGGGPHFCLGSHLARMQLRSLFGELLTRVPDLSVGEPVWLAGNFINGIKRLPVTFGEAS